MPCRRRYAPHRLRIVAVRRYCHVCVARLLFVGAPVVDLLRRARTRKPHSRRRLDLITTAPISRTKIANRS